MEFGGYPGVTASLCIGKVAYRKLQAEDVSTVISPLAGKAPPSSLLIDVRNLLAAYSGRRPDPAVAEQRVSFGTSGHRGSSLSGTFNERHILAISQAICDYRRKKGIDGPLFIGIDTHALSAPAFESAMEVLAANGVEVLMAKGGEFTPTPAISRAILCHNRGRDEHFADGIVVTPSHNPPDNGGFKYNPPNGGPADDTVTGWIEARANGYLEAGLDGVKRVPFEEARRAATTREFDFLGAYVEDLASVLDMEVIRGAGLHLGVDPLGGAGVHYWGRIAERYKLDLTIVNEAVDPTFRFMTVDWDGRIRMDPSSPYAMQGLIGLKDRFDVAFACDTDHDRHGIVTKSEGLLQPNHYLSAAISYLFRHRPHWNAHAAIGKTVVSSQMIDRVAAKLGRPLYEVPVGFKWFASGLLDGALAFAGEESAGAAFARRDGTAWTTDKDGIAASLLSAEMTARLGRDPGEIYRALTDEFGAPVYSRIDAKATAKEKRILAGLSAHNVMSKTLAGDAIEAVLTKAPGDGAAIGGIKVVAKHAWFAARPSGTEAVYKIYAESLRGPEHLRAVQAEAQQIVSAALASAH